jgi:RimJ/RimL family protein N-acetyltransferase
MLADREILQRVRDPDFTTIETERLVLRRFDHADAAAFAAYRADPEIARYQSWDETYSVEDAVGFVDSLRDVDPGTPGEWFQFAVARRHDGALVGDCAMHVDPRDPNLAEIGYTLVPVHQGHGYATEAAEALIGYAVARLHVTRVHAIVDGRNTPSIRVAERLGFTRVARTRTTFKGERCVEVTYELRHAPEGVDA